MYRGTEYVKWLDTRPKAFLSYRDWMFTYYPKEDINSGGIDIIKKEVDDDE